MCFTAREPRYDYLFALSVQRLISTSILGVTQPCIQGEAALKALRDCAPTLLYSDSQVGANCRRSKPVHKVQVSLLFVEHHVVSLDMPPLCKWPEVVGVPIVSGDGQCSDVVSEVFGHLRSYLCPHVLAGIYPKLVLVENSSRDRLRSSSFPEDSVC